VSLVSELLVDPRVSRAKFERQLKDFDQLRTEYLRRGWWLLEAKFPEVFIVFVSSKTRPLAAVFGVLIDFSNYDLWAPSVKLVHPFTRVPYKTGELPTALVRAVPVASVAPLPISPTNPTTPSGATGPQHYTPQPLAQAYDLEDVPFICLPGVREYHENPAHTGDSWLLHRGRGEGTLHFIVEQLSRYGLEPIHQLQFGFQVMFQGFAVGDLPK
jgi:hypothetical protein